MANTAVRLIAPVLMGAFILLFPADGLRALGLGEARVDSWLGQPLDVSIRLLEVESEAIESVSVGPASLEDFERLGVPSESLGLGLEVTVDRSTEPSIVRVRSQRPVNDPIVQILIDARWSSGRVLREYTLFLDPPVRESTAPAREVSQPTTEPSRETTPEPAEREPRQPAETAAPAARPSTPPAQADDSAPSSVSAGADSVQVAAGDTLWGIAQNWRPDSSLSMDQVMLAIFNRNRDAFMGENINRLRSDALLEMPGEAEVRSVDRADAERLVREHMRSWQPAVSDSVPVVSDAAVRETPERVEEEVAETSGSQDDFRLDVVPPEEDRYSESSAVADSEIRQVRGRLAEVEEEIIVDGFYNEAFDEHIAEIREALEQRDMAGLAVAEESLAELETRLREAREARAEEERLAQSVDAEQATDSAERDEIADYMRDLEEKFGAQADDDASVTAGEDAGDSATEESTAPASEQTAEEEAAVAAGDDAETVQDQVAEESDEPAQSERSETDTQSSSAGILSWLWLAAGLLVLVIIAVVAVLWLRQRRSGTAGGSSAEARDAIDAARATVTRDSGDLAAHLALLKLLANQGREQEFTDAFDNMYQEVDDESASQWQEALSLASTLVPDHPLLTPRETSIDDDFDRRADEMLGMLDVDESEAEAESRREEAGDDTFDLGFEEESDAQPSFEDDDESGGAGKEESFDEDMDLAVLSERLDDPSLEPGRDKSLEGDEDDADFGEFKEIDEFSAGEATEETPDEHPEAPVDLDDEQAAEPDLDLGPAKEQEADDVFGEAGARDHEDLDLSLDVDEAEPATSDEGLDFDLGEGGDSQSLAPEPEEAAESSEEPERSDELDWSEDLEPSGEFELSEESDSSDESEASVRTELDEAEQPAPSGGALSDEDADVKLDLARAYMSVDLADSARTVLEEVISDGSEEKRAEAQKLLDSIV